jgi:hypothetical protein
MALEIEVITSPWALLSYVTIGTTAIFLSKIFEKEKVIEKQQQKEFSSDRDKEIFHILREHPISDKEKLEILNKNSKMFFSELYQLPKEMEFSDIKEEFIKIRNEKGIEFSDIMINLLYTGNEPTKKEIIQLTNILEEIVKTKKSRNERSNITTIDEAEKKIENFFSTISKPIQEAITKEEQRIEHYVREALSQDDKVRIKHRLKQKGKLTRF